MNNCRRRRRRPVPWLLGAALLVSTGVLAAVAPSAVAGASRKPDHRALQIRAAQSRAGVATAATVWLCRPGMRDDPCASSLATTVVTASGATSVVTENPKASKFDCFYIYPTVSAETSVNADLRVQTAETAAAIAQASRFSTVCRVFAPMYRQITLAGLLTLPTAASSPEVIAYDSIRSGFEDYLAHYNDGRPVVFIGHSQGAAMLIMLLQHFVDESSALRRRLVLALILGGNVVVHTGWLTGGSFKHIPTCTAYGEKGCVIAYSTFPGLPPSSSLFGRPGQGVSLLSGQFTTHELQVVCVNPAAIGGGTGELSPYFPSEGLEATPWVFFPKLYSARCESSSGATWLQVTKSSGVSDHRPVVKETDGSDWGYHPYDVNLALGNLVADTAAAEASWFKGARSK